MIDLQTVICDKKRCLKEDVLILKKYLKVKVTLVCLGGIYL